MTEKLLLHHCCAPCSPSVVDGFSSSYDLVGFWCNPNIHPEEEYALRLASLKCFLAELSIPLMFGRTMTPDEWRNEALAAVPDRCSFCYRLRLMEAAFTAHREGIPCFSTTLLSSPYQKHDLIRSIGEECAEQSGVRFIYRDFRPRFYEGKNRARDKGYYMQKYCGCSYSKDERFKNKSNSK